MFKYVMMNIHKANPKRIHCQVAWDLTGPREQGGAWENGKLGRGLCSCLLLQESSPPQPCCEAGQGSSHCSGDPSHETPDGTGAWARTLARLGSERLWASPPSLICVPKIPSCSVCVSDTLWPWWGCVSLAPTLLSPSPQVCVVLPREGEQA